MFRPFKAHALRTAALLSLAGCAAAAPRVGEAPAQAGTPSPVRMIGEGALSTDLNEFGGTLSPDGSEIYFAISVPRSYTYAIVRSRRRGGGWTEPEVLPFSGVSRDYDPVLSPDGRRMYFVSDRGDNGFPDTPAQPELWVAERDGERGWKPPRRVPPPVTTPRSSGRYLEHFASEARSGTLYFAAERPGLRGVDLFRARRQGDGFADPEPLGAPVETPGLEGEPMIAPDESFLVFAAYERAGGYGHFDLYISVRTPAGWGTPVNLGPRVNTAARDYSPRLAPDGHTLIFTSERHFALEKPGRALTYPRLIEGLEGTTNGNGNLYKVDLRALGVLPAARTR